MRQLHGGTQQLGMQNKADIACHTTFELSPSVTRHQCPVWQVRCPAGQSRQFRLARACAQQRYDDVIGNFPA